MLREVKIYDKQEGIVTVGVDDETHIFYLYENGDNWPSKQLNILENDFIDESGVVNKLFLFYKHLITRDLALVPEPEYTFVNKENQRGIIRYDVGTGYLYPNGNSQIYISKRRSNIVAQKLPIDVRGASIQAYKISFASYIVKDIETERTYLVPYYVLNTMDYLENPLLHFQPITVENNISHKDFEWTKIPNIPIWINRVLENIGSTDIVYIKDSNNGVYKTRINYAALSNFTKYKTSTKLLKGLMRLSAPGVYLKHLEELTKYIIEEDTEWN